MHQPIQLVSSDGRVILRQYTMEDAPAAFDLIDRNREHLSQFDEATASHYPNLESFQQSIGRDPKRLRFGVWNETNELVGSINLTPTGDRPDIGIVGYYLGGEYQHKGYMQTSVKTLVDYAFKERGYTELRANVHVDNIGSASVLHASGLQLNNWGNKYLNFRIRK